MEQGWDSYVGPAAGVTTSLLWAFTSILFTAAAKRLGATTVNAARIGIAIVLLGGTHRLLAGGWWPDATARQVVLLGASGVLGLSIGDGALFSAFVHIGPRVAMLIMTTAPIFAVLFGWIALGETLGGWAWIGMALTVAGVAWVVVERPRAEVVTLVPHRLRGTALAFVATACQAVGLLLSKQGMGHGWLPREQHLDPQAATFLRMLFAGVGVLPLLALQAVRARRRSTAAHTPARSDVHLLGFGFTLLGGLVGPYLGVWLSLVATDRAPLGIAQTLCSLTPVFLLPLVVLINKERVSWRAVLGAIVAVAGTALLFAPARGG